MVSFNENDRRVMVRKTRWSLLKFANNLSKNIIFFHNYQESGRLRDFFYLSNLAYIYPC